MMSAIYTSMFMVVRLLGKVGVGRINPWGELLKQGGLVVIIHKSLGDLLAMFAVDCVAKPHVICRSCELRSNRRTVVYCLQS